MIRSFRDRATENLWRRVPGRKFQAVQKAARIKLAFLDAAESLMDLSLPGLRLEKLSGDRKGQYSIRVNDRYRICFEWRSNDAHQVEVTDYH
jgi:proteic killer suppression protein